MVDKAQVAQVLELVRPALQADGTEDGVVKVKMLGHCAGCPMSQMTIQGAVERTLKERIPEVKRVMPVR